MRNTIFLYYNLSVAIITFFSLVFKVYINNFLKKQVFDNMKRIFLKFIDIDLTIVFIT